MGFSLKNSILKHKFVCIALFILLLYLSPNIFFSSSSRHLVHDNLDGNPVCNKNLVESGKMFAPNSDIVPNALGGLPRGLLPSSLNTMQLLYELFSPPTAYNINIIFIHLVAFLGMYLLLSRYVAKDDENKWIAVFVALLFALLPFWPSGGLGVSGQPLLLFSFLNFYWRRHQWYDWLIVCAVPFHSLFVFSPLFFMFFTGLAFLVVSVRDRKVNYVLLLAMALFVICSIVVEHRLFEMQFVEKIETHRSNVNLNGILNFNGMIGVTLLLFLKGHYHFHSLQFPVIIILPFLALIWSKQHRSGVVLGLAVIMLACLLFVLPQWKGLQFLMSKVKLLTTLSLRFQAILPAAWYILAGYSILAITTSGPKFAKWLAVGLVSVACVFTLFSVNASDYFNSVSEENSFYRTYFDNKNLKYQTFDEYYQTKLFDEVKRQLPPGDFYVMCLGFDPVAAQYNGYYTLDGYYSLIPKNYFTKLQEVTKRETEKGGLAMADSRCYFIPSQIWAGKEVWKKNVVITNLEYDYELLRSMGGRYILSKYKIESDPLTNVISLEKEGFYVYQF